MERADVVLLRKLGIISGETPMVDAFLLWGNVLRDRIVVERAAAMPGPNKKYPAIMASENDAIAAMTAEEKIALRDRVLGVVQFEVKSRTT
jgi:hypothetical protein